MISTDNLFSITRLKVGAVFPDSEGWFLGVVVLFCFVFASLFVLGGLFGLLVCLCGFFILLLFLIFGEGERSWKKKCSCGHQDKTNCKWWRGVPTVGMFCQSCFWEKRHWRYEGELDTYRGKHQCRHRWVRTLEWENACEKFSLSQRRLRLQGMQRIFWYLKPEDAMNGDRK